MQGYRWVVPAERQVAWESFPVRQPGLGEILLRSEASLVSAGTELAIYTGIHQGLTNPNVDWPKFPQAVGYMGLTRVEAVGEGVEGYRPGDRLLTSTGHASHTIVDLRLRHERRLWHAPEETPAHHLVMARLAKTAFTALAAAQITAAQSVVVLGLGIIGQMTLRLFQAAGAWPVVGVDPVALRREAAVRGGAVAALDPAAGAPEVQLREYLPRGADIVVDCTGWASALPGAMALAREAGAVIVLGSPRGTAPDVDFYRDLHRRSLRVIGAHDSGVGQDVREGFPWTDDRVVPALLDWVRSERLPVGDLITHHVPPSALPAMYQGLLDDKESFLGVVLDWSRVGEPGA